MYECIKVINNNCTNTCHSAFLPLNGSCALFPTIYKPRAVQSRIYNVFHCTDRYSCPPTQLLPTVQPPSLNEKESNCTNLATS